MSNSDLALLVLAIPGVLLMVGAAINVRSLHRLEREIAAQKGKMHPAE